MHTIDGIELEVKRAQPKEANPRSREALKAQERARFGGRGYDAAQGMQASGPGMQGMQMQAMSQLLGTGVGFASAPGMAALGGAMPAGGYDAVQLGGNANLQALLMGQAGLTGNPDGMGGVNSIGGIDLHAAASLNGMVAQQQAQGLLHGGVHGLGGGLMGGGLPAPSVATSMGHGGIPQVFREDLAAMNQLAGANQLGSLPLSLGGLRLVQLNGNAHTAGFQP